MPEKIAKYSVRHMISHAFTAAILEHGELHKTWVDVSVRIQKLLPESLIALSVQNAGKIDLVLRCMENEACDPNKTSAKHGIDSMEDLIETSSFGYQCLLSDWWLGSVYAITYAITTKIRELSENNTLKTLHNDLNLVRVMIEKHEIAKDRSLTEPLLMNRGDESQIYAYSKEDPKRSYYTNPKLSNRGSLAWRVVSNVKTKEQKLIERRELSDQFLNLWKTLSIPVPDIVEPDPGQSQIA